MSTSTLADGGRTGEDRSGFVAVDPSIHNKPYGMTREETVTSLRDTVTSAGFIMENMSAWMSRESLTVSLSCLFNGHHQALENS